MRLSWPSFSCLLVFATTGTAQSPPTQTPLPSDAELHAAYCIPVIQNDIGLLNQELDRLSDMKAKAQNLPADSLQDEMAFIEKRQFQLPQDISNRESALNRLQLFLIPRLHYLDPTAIMAASSRGTSDIQDWSAKTRQCLKDISQLRPDETKAHLEKCMSENIELVNRLNACRNPTWLPF
jgi:hypothetical protein